MPWRKGSRIRVVNEAQAEGRVREIFTDIKQALGLPMVNVSFRAFAVFPQFLEAYWRTFAPVVRTNEFFALAGRLRADAYTRTHAYFGIPNLCTRMEALGLSEAARQELTDIAEVLHYANPLVLLMLAAQIQAFERPVGGTGRATPHADAPYMGRESIVVIDEEHASPRVKEIYEDARHTLQVPFVSTDLRAFARWPDFLESYWQALKPMTESALYESSLFGVRETAMTLAHELPLPVETATEQLLESGLTEEQIASLARITEVFVNGLSGVLLNVSFAKIALEGGNGRPVATSVEHEKAA